MTDRQARVSRLGMFFFAVAVSGALVAAVEGPGFGRGPLPGEILAALDSSGPGAAAPDCAGAGGVLARAGLAWLAGAWTAALVCALRRLHTAAGIFGVVAAAALASTITSALLGLTAVGVSTALAWGAALGVGVALAPAAPLLRDRGLLSLLLISLFVGAVVVAGRRQAIAESAVAHRLERAREALLQAGVQRLFASVGSEVSLAFRQALAGSLRPPFRDEAVDLLCVEHDSPEVGLLRSGGWPGVRFEAGGAQLLPPVTRAAADERSFPHEVVLRPLADRGPVAVVRPAEGRFTMRVVTPAGVVRQHAVDPVHGVGLVGAALERYRELVRGLPPGSPLLVRVETPLFSDGSAWLEVRL